MRRKNRAVIERFFTFRLKILASVFLFEALKLQNKPSDAENEGMKISRTADRTIRRIEVLKFGANPPLTFLQKWGTKPQDHFCFLSIGKSDINCVRSNIDP